MRWHWIDQITELKSGQRMAAIKNVTLSEDAINEHFSARIGPDGTREEAIPVMPGSLMIEGMAQTAGLLVGEMSRFQEKVVLAKVNRAVIERDVIAGQTIKYEAEIEHVDPIGVATRGKISALDHVTGTWFHVGEVELIFSHLDQNRAGERFGEDNFVFSDNFKYIMSTVPKPAAAHTDLDIAAR